VWYYSLTEELPTRPKETSQHSEGEGNDSKRNQKLSLNSDDWMAGYVKVCALATVLAI
jgi:hypothetical protein